MKTLRRYSSEGRAPARPVPPLRAGSRSAPPRPRWGRLYLALIAIGLVGAAAHVAVGDHRLAHVLDPVSALALFAVLVGWVRGNRIALTRLDEPDAGAGTPTIRRVRSRRRDDERIVLPYGVR